MNANNNELFELEEMRQQLAILKDKVNSQKIVSDHLIREVMRSKYGWYERRQIVWSIVAILMIPYFTYFFGSLMNLTWWFIAFTIVYFIATIICNIIGYHTLNMKHLSTESMHSVTERILRKRRNDRMAKIIVWPMMVVWLLAFFAQISYINGSYELTPAVLGGIIGLVIGVVCGIIYLRKYNRMLSEMEREARQFVDEN